MNHPGAHPAHPNGYVTSDQRPTPPPELEPEPETDEEVDVNGKEFVALKLAPLQYVCRPWVVEGLCLIAGRPKIGKTTLLRQLTRAMASGNQFFGAPCHGASVLFLCLEESKRLMHAKLCAMGGEADDWKHVTLRFEWPCGGDGVYRLRQWLLSHPTPRQRVIIVDSVTRFRDPPDPRTPAFQQDYLALRMLADLCKEFPGLVILALHHTTKAMSDDPVACISGTYGLVAAADNYWVLLRQGEKFRLHCGGRMWEGDTSDFELERVNGGWNLLGPWDSIAPSLPLRERQVFEALKGGAKTRRTLGETLDIDPPNISHVLAKLEKNGLVRRVANGWEVVR